MINVRVNAAAEVVHSGDVGYAVFSCSIIFRCQQTDQVWDHSTPRFSETPLTVPSLPEDTVVGEGNVPVVHVNSLMVFGINYCIIKNKDYACYI